MPHPGAVSSFLTEAGHRSMSPQEISDFVHSISKGEQNSTVLSRLEIDTTDIVATLNGNEPEDYTPIPGHLYGTPTTDNRTTILRITNNNRFPFSFVRPYWSALPIDSYGRHIPGAPRDGDNAYILNPRNPVVLGHFENDYQNGQWQDFPGVMDLYTDGTITLEKYGNFDVTDDDGTVWTAPGVPDSAVKAYQLAIDMTKMVSFPNNVTFTSGVNFQDSENVTAGPITVAWVSNDGSFQFVINDNPEGEDLSNYPVTFQNNAATTNFSGLFNAKGPVNFNIGADTIAYLNGTDYRFNINQSPGGHDVTFQCNAQHVNLGVGGATPSVFSIFGATGLTGPYGIGSGGNSTAAWTADAYTKAVINSIINLLVAWGPATDARTP